MVARVILSHLRTGFVDLLYVRLEDEAALDDLSQYMMYLCMNT